MSQNYLMQDLTQSDPDLFIKSLRDELDWCNDLSVKPSSHRELQMRSSMAHAYAHKLEVCYMLKLQELGVERTGILTDSFQVLHNAINDKLWMGTAMALNDVKKHYTRMVKYADESEGVVPVPKHYGDDGMDSSEKGPMKYCDELHPALRFVIYDMARNIHSYVGVGCGSMSNDDARDMLIRDLNKIIHRLNRINDWGVEDDSK